MEITSPRTWHAVFGRSAMPGQSQTDWLAAVCTTQGHTRQLLSLTYISLHPTRGVAEFHARTYRQFIDTPLAAQDFSLRLIKYIAWMNKLTQAKIYTQARSFIAKCLVAATVICKWPVSYEQITYRLLMLFVVRNITGSGWTVVQAPC